MSAEKITFHIVHSVKGGCGKTAFSLFKSLELAYAAGIDKPKVLFLDADLLGSGLKELIYARDEKNFLKDNDVRIEKYCSGRPKVLGDGFNNYFIYGQKYQENTLNSFISEPRKTFMDIRTESVVLSINGGVIDQKVTIDMEEEALFNGYIDFVFCSTDINKKNRFKYKNGNTPAIDIGKHRLRIRRLLEEICQYGINGRRSEKGSVLPEYSDVVIDMPPGYDEYSSILLDQLIEFAREYDDRIQLDYYAVTTDDRSHIQTMVDDILYMIYNSQNYRLYNKIHVVFNSTLKESYEFIKPKDIVDSQLKDISDEIECITYPFQEDYNIFCRDDISHRFFNRRIKKDRDTNGKNKL